MSEKSAKRLIEKASEGGFCITPESTLRAHTFLVTSGISFEKMFATWELGKAKCPKTFGLVDGAIRKIIETEHDDIEMRVLRLWSARNLFFGLLLPLYDESEECWVFCDDAVAAELAKALELGFVINDSCLSEGLVSTLEVRLGEYGQVIRCMNEHFCCDLDCRIVGMIDAALTIIYDSVDAWACKKDDVEGEVERIGRNESSGAS
jgi:hypothetical protein